MEVFSRLSDSLLGIFYKGTYSLPEDKDVLHGVFLLLFFFFDGGGGSDCFCFVQTCVQEISVMKQLLETMFGFM